jgi:uncharacterized membrane protein YedE/YeeE
MKELSIIWLGGAIRGAVAFALILAVTTHHKKVVITTTLGIVMFTTIVFGAIMPLWHWLFKDESKTRPHARRVDFHMGNETTGAMVTHPYHKF